MDDKVRTKVVAIPMPMADSSFLETPMKGQRPRNLTSTKLLTSTVPIRMRANSVMVAVASARWDGMAQESTRIWQPSY